MSFAKNAKTIIYKKKNGEYPWCALFRKILKIAVKLVCLLCMALLCILGVLCGFLDNFFLLSVLVAFFFFFFFFFYNNSMLIEHAVYMNSLNG